MSKSVLISIRPEWCAKIASGEKTIEVRKTRPKLPTPFKCYIYMTKQKKGEDGWLAAVCAENRCYYGAGSVIGEFVCECISRIIPVSTAERGSPHTYFGLSEIGVAATCLSIDEMLRYGGWKPLYGWHISELKIYPTPKELSEFLKYGYDDALTYWEDLHCIGTRGCGSVQYPPMPKEEDYRLSHPPRSWCYVEELT